MSAYDEEVQLDYNSDDDSEFLGIPSEASHSTHANDSNEFTFQGAGDDNPETSPSQEPLTMAAAVMQLGTIVEAMVQSQQMFQAAVLNRDTRHRKVYVSMPDKFDGKIGDYIDGWLEQFQTWFAHREKVEGPVDPRTRIETAIQNTHGDISLLLSKHKADYAEFPTWESFANFMKASYGSKESGFVRYTHLRLLTQGAGETVDAFYARFYKLCSR